MAVLRGSAAAGNGSGAEEPAWLGGCDPSILSWSLPRLTLTLPRFASSQASRKAAAPRAPRIRKGLSWKGPGASSGNFH